MSDCLFCKIATGAIPAKIAAETDSLVAFHDIHPQAPTHILIIPKQHIASAKVLTPEQSFLLGEMTILAQQLVSGSDFRLVINAGLGAGQTVFHLHMHVLSGRDLSWPPG